MPDTTRPIIVSTTPLPNGIEHSPHAPIYVIFSESMSESTLTTSNIGLYKDPMDAVPITVSYNNGFKMLTITPSDDLEFGIRYSVVIRGMVTDVAGNTMGQDYWFNFWTTEPTGIVPPSEPQEQPDMIPLKGYLEVKRTDPDNYTTNIPINNISPLRIYFNDRLAIGNRCYFGIGSDPNPMMIGRDFFEVPEDSLSSYITIENQEVLGDPYVPHMPPTLSLLLNEDYIEIDMDGIMPNNEYLVTIHSGIEGLTTNPMTEDYQFVFTSSYSPLYAGYNIVRLKIGPMLQMAMAWIPNDTLNRFLYEASREADRLHPTPIDINNPPSYVVEFVIYQGTLSALYAALAIFAAGGAGVRKRLADLEIDKDARGLMPAIDPLLNDLRKKRDDFMDDVISGSQYGATPRYTVKGIGDPRRPITNSSWRRLPLRYLQEGGEPKYPITNDIGRNLDWLYTSELTVVNR